MQTTVQLSPRENALSYLGAFVLIVLMVGAAAFWSDPEVVLPEIAAMAVALWAYRDQRWMRHPEKIFLWPSLTALMGFGINVLSIPYAGKLVLALVLMLAFFVVARYSLAPALATGFLPIVTNAVEWSFVLSIVLTSAILMAGVVLLRMKTSADRQSNVDYRMMGTYVCIMLLWLALAVFGGHPHMALIPPVAVVIYESLQMGMYNGKMMVKQVLVLTASAAIGVILYAVVQNWVLVVALDMVIVFLLLHSLKMRMPAAYAFPLLAFVFPQESVQLLPVATLANSAFSLGLVLLIRRRFVGVGLPRDVR
ncbi:hypothetical protein [Pseudomonas sp. NUPR-001]|uniref:hypothetical protein n=1 Tax=Pseudomonas sp. NUPR-001 TaxID=3416058 RepID=UPI003F998F96